MKKILFYPSVVLSILFLILPATASITTNDPYLKYQTYLNKINIGNVWQDYTGNGVIVAVLDSGVQQNNPDLKDALWKNSKEIPNNSTDDDNNGYVDDYYGYNFVANNANMDVYEAHGTSVASLIAAQRDNSYGIAGIAPEVKIMSLTVCSENGCNPSDISKAIVYAVNKGADIINMSLGSNGSLGYKSSYDSALQYAINNGVLVVAAAGNSDPEGIAYGNDLNIMKQSPVSNEDDANIIFGVGATKAAMNKPAFWSSYSDRYVDVWAPGERIAALSVESFSGLSAEYVDGTSFSAPIVAATAALLKDKHPSWNYVDIMSQIISYSSTIDGYKFLNIYDILNGNERKTELGSISPSVINGETKIKIYGKNFYNDIKFSINNSNLFVQVPANAIKFLATNKAEIDLTKVPYLKADSNSYTLKIENSSASNNNLSKQFTIAFIGQSQNNPNTDTGNSNVGNGLIPEKTTTTQSKLLVSTSTKAKNTSQPNLSQQSTVTSGQKIVYTTASSMPSIIVSTSKNQVVDNLLEEKNQIINLSQLFFVIILLNGALWFYWIKKKK